MAIIAVIDPEVLVLGGPVGIHPLLLAQVHDTLDELARASTRSLPVLWVEIAPLRGALDWAAATRANISRVRTSTVSANNEARPATGLANDRGSGWRPMASPAWPASGALGRPRRARR
jgi:hypothetical protein